MVPLRRLRLLPHCSVYRCQHRYTCTAAFTAPSYVMYDYAPVLTIHPKLHANVAFCYLLKDGGVYNKFHGEIDPDGYGFEESL